MARHGTARTCLRVGREERLASAEGRLVKSVSLTRKRWRPAGDSSSAQSYTSFSSTEESAACLYSLAKKLRI